MRYQFLYSLLYTHYKKIAIIALGFYLLVYLPIFCSKRMRHPRCDLPAVANTMDELLLDIAAVETNVDSFLVPNFVHFYRFGASAKQLNLIDVLCLRAVFRTQRPDRIFIHTDDVEAAVKSFQEYEYGRQLVAVPGFTDVLHFLPYPQPQHVFGLTFSTKYREWHMSDLARLRILRKYGGIFLDNDVYLLRNIDTLRKNELTVMASSGVMENSVIVAHRDSRFLATWLTSYMQYDSLAALHHKTPAFLQLLREFRPAPFMVHDGVAKSNVKKFFEDDIQHCETCFAVDLDTQPRDGLPEVDYFKYIAAYGKGFVERYFKMDDDMRTRVNYVSRYLFDNLLP